MLSMLPLHLATMPQLFQKFVQSQQSTTFIRKFLNKFFCSITLKTHKFFLQYSIVVAQTHVYAKSSSATKKYAFDIQVSKYIN